MENLCGHFCWVETFTTFRRDLKLHRRNGQEQSLWGRKFTAWISRSRGASKMLQLPSDDGSRGGQYPDCRLHSCRAVGWCSAEAGTISREASWASQRKYAGACLRMRGTSMHLWLWRSVHRLTDNGRCSPWASGSLAVSSIAFVKLPLSCLCLLPQQIISLSWEEG